MISRIRSLFIPATIEENEDRIDEKDVIGACCPPTEIADDYLILSSSGAS